MIFLLRSHDQDATSFQPNQGNTIALWLTHQFSVIILLRTRIGVNRNGSLLYCIHELCKYW